MTNVFKWYCKRCKKITFSPIFKKPKVKKPKIRIPKVKTPKIKEPKIRNRNTDQDNGEGMRCPNCDRANLRFVRRMTNVDKYICKNCKKVTIVPIHESPVPDRVSGRHRFVHDDTGCDGQIMNGRIGFMCFDHQGKANKILEALNHNGKYLKLDCHRRYKGLAFVLTDTDIMGRRFKLNHMRNSGVGRFFIYPHAARPDIVNDIYREWEFTSCHFVTTEGHAEIMRLFGYSRPMMSIGWLLCPQKQFRPRKDPINILFAPIHPRCSKVDQDVNKAAFKRLEKLAKAGDINLTVRFIRSLADSGLEVVEHPNIKYTVGYMNQGYDQIDNSDVVVAHQTFLYLAVARGVPALGMAETLPTHIQIRGKKPIYAPRWNNYVHLLRYPYDILEAGNNGQVVKMLQKVIRQDNAVDEWRRRMIGQTFRADRFLKKLEQYL